MYLSGWYGIVGLNMKFLDYAFISRCDLRGCELFHGRQNTIKQCEIRTSSTALSDWYWHKGFHSSMCAPSSTYHWMIWTSVMPVQEISSQFIRYGGNKLFFVCGNLPSPTSFKICDLVPNSDEAAWNPRLNTGGMGYRVRRRVWGRQGLKIWGMPPPLRKTFMVEITRDLGERGSCQEHI